MRYRLIPFPCLFLIIVAVVVLLCTIFQPRQGANAAAAGTVTQLRAVTLQDPPGGIMIGLGRPQWIDAVVLTANVAQSYTVPTGANYLLFSANNDFYAKYGGTAAVPATNVTDGSGSELNPSLRSVGGATAVGLISPYAAVVTICAYK